MQKCPQCVLSFAVAAVERDWVEPVLVKEAVLYIEGGRHPLCELCVDTFVSTANAFVLRGGVPVFVDIRDDLLRLT